MLKNKGKDDIIIFILRRVPESLSLEGMLKGFNLMLRCNSLSHFPTRTCKLRSRTSVTDGSDDGDNDVDGFDNHDDDDDDDDDVYDYEIVNEGNFQDLFFSLLEF